MNPDTRETTAELAAELAFIRQILELAIDFEMIHGRHPSAVDVQRQLHGRRDDPPTSTQH